VIRRLLRGLIDVPKQLVVLLLRAYRAVISPLYGPTCRFYPSCSEYALVAVDRHGVLRGGRLAVWRLLRCNPWNPGGVDPVPPVEGTVGTAEVSGAVHDCSAPKDAHPTETAGTTPAPSTVRRVA